MNLAFALDIRPIQQASSLHQVELIVAPPDDVTHGKFNVEAEQLCNRMSAEGCFTRAVMSNEFYLSELPLHDITTILHPPRPRRLHVAASCWYIILSL